MNKLSPLFSAVAVASLGLTSIGSLSALGVLSLGLSLGFPAPAHAELIVSSSSAKQPQPKSETTPVAPVKAAVSSSTASSSDSFPISSSDKSSPNYLPSWGYNVPLGSAVFQIIPSGYVVKFDPSIDLKQIVSWHGGVAWQSALTGMLATHGLVAIIDPSNHQIKIDCSSPSVPVTTTIDTMPLSQSTHSHHPQHSGTVYDSLNSSASAPVIPPATTATTFAAAPAHDWVLDPSLTLKQNVTEWAKQAGWHVEWNAVDYPVVAKVVFHGAFDGNDGPIATLIQAYKQASQPLTAHLTTMDHVVYVENTTYQPQVVLPISGNANAGALFHDDSVYGPKFNTSSGDPAQTSINTPDQPDPAPAPALPASSGNSGMLPPVSEHFSAPPAGFSVSTDHPALVAPTASAPSGTASSAVLGKPVVITPKSIDPPVNQLGNQPQQ